MKPYYAVSLLLVLALACIVPVQGSDRYIGGSPEISAYITGVNEFSPGQDATITVILQNGGTNTVKFTNQGTLADEDASTTAKLVTAGLSDGGAPIIIKTDPQNLGDIKSPGKTSVTFTAKITSNATLGEYTLPLVVRYKYLTNDVADQASSDTIQYHYTAVNKTLPLTIKIKPEVKIDVLNATGTNLVVGTEGYINLTIKNIGYEDGKQATVHLIRNGDSAVIPTDSSVYIGDFSRNGIVTCTYKVAISSDARAQAYPVDVAVTYTNAEGDTVASSTETIGVPVADKLTFTVVSAPAVVTQGQTSVITVEYKNLGSITANEAQARLSAVEPFTSSDETAYLGDILPGGTATAQYAISASDSAVPGMYSLDTEVRYRDALDNSQISDSFKAQVEIAASSGSSGALNMSVVVTLVVLVLIGAGYYVFVMRKKR